MKKRYLGVLVLFLCLSVCVFSLPQTQDVFSNLKENISTKVYNLTSSNEVNVMSASEVGYIVDKETGVIIGVSDKGISATITIPKEIDGVTITGIGTHAFSGCQLTGLIFEEGSQITSIGTYAFQNNPGITELILPESITEVGAYAFYQCSGLVDVKLPSNLLTLGGSAFRDCTSLETINLPNTIETLGSYAFYNCTSLIKIELPSLLTNVETYTFYNCINLESVVLGDKITNIAASAFRQCSSLDTMNFPDSLITIETAAFYDATSLENATLTNVKTIGNSAFYNCSSLNSVTFQKVETIGTYAFYRTALTEVVLPNTLKSVGNYGFYYVTMMTKVTLPDTDVTFGNYVFSSNSSLSEIDFGTGNHTFGTYTFNGCAFEEIVIPDTISTGISNYMFSYCKSLKKVTIGDNVSSIGSYAFQYSTIEDITIGESVTSVGAYAFRSCTELVTITFPENVTTVGNYTFYGCTNLKEIRIPYKETDTITGSPWSANSPTTVDIYWKDTIIEKDWLVSATTNTAYKYIGTSTDIFVPSSVTYNNQSYDVTIIGRYSCASKNYSVNSLTIPEGIEEIQEYAFSASLGITSLELPDSLITIGSSAFYYAKFLNTISLGENLQTINSSAFAYTTFTELTIPESVTSIGSSAFANSQVTTLIIEGDEYNEDTALTIGSYAFNTSRVADIDLGQNVVSIETYAFNKCYYLESITIPDSVQSIAANVFATCSKLTSIYIPTKVLDTIEGQPWGATNAIVYWKDMTNVNDWLVDFSDPENATVVTYLGSDTELTIPSTGELSFARSESQTIKITSIREGALYGNKTVTKLTIEDGIEVIGDNAFYNCTNLKEVDLPDSIIEIGTSAFYYCTSIKEFTIPKNATTLGSSLLSYCTSLEKLTVLADIQSIPASFCNGNTVLKEVNLPENYVEIGAYAFQNCKALESFTFSDSLVTIGNSAFSSCTLLTEVKFPEGLETIGDSAFGSTGLIELDMPNSVTSIGQYCFRGSALQRVKVSDGVTIIPIYAFAYCASLTDIDLGNGVTHLYGASFYSCTALEEITFPEQLSYIYSYKPGLYTYYTFYGCSNLKSIYARYKDQDGIASATWGISDYETVVYWKGVYNFDGWIINTQTGTVLKYIGEDVNLEIPTSVIIPEGEENEGTEVFVEHIGNSAFVNRTIIESMVIPEGIKTIGNSSFYNTSISEIVIPSSVETIGSSAFEYCSLLESVEFKYGLHTIGSSAFGYTPIKVLEIPGSVETIMSYAFRECSELTTLTLENGVKTIGSYAFYNCINLEDFTLPNSLTNISGAFRNCTKITSVIIPDSVTNCTSAFAGCSSLETVIVGTGVTAVGTSFASLESLKSIEFRSSATILGTGAFDNCPSLEIIRIGRARVSAPTSMTSLQPWSGPSDLKAYYLGEYVLFNHEVVVNEEDPTKRDILLNASIDGSVIVTIKYPDGTSENVSSNQNDFTYTVSKNGTYTFIGIDSESVETVYSVVVDDIGIPNISCQDAIIGLNELESLTKEDALSLIEAKASSEGGEPLEVVMSDADLTRIKAMSKPGDHVTVTISTTSQEGFTRTAQATITAQTVYGYYKVHHYIENTSGTGYTEYRISEFSEEAGTLITAEPLTIEGFTFNEDIDGTLSSGIVSSSGVELSLNLYYERNTYTVNFEYEDGREAYPTQLVKYQAKIIVPTAEDLEVRDGYSFESWTPEVVDVVSENQTYVAHYGANSTYKVEYYLENLEDDGYTLMSEDTQTLGAPDGALVSGEVLTYKGFSFDAENENTVASGNVLENDSLVLKMYYTRNKYTIKFVYDDDVHTNVIEPQILKYGATLVEPTLEEIVANEVNSTKGDEYYENHEFSHWDDDIDEIVDSNMTYTTIYISNDEKYGTYYIEYFKETLDGTYEKVDTITMEDERGTYVEVSVEEIEGFSLNEEKSVLSGTIPSFMGRTLIQQLDISILAADDLKLEVYYDRNIYEINFIYENDSLVVPTQYLKYEAEIIVPKVEDMYVVDNYAFYEWTPSVPEIATKDETYRAIYLEEVTYTITYYQQNANDDGYRMYKNMTSKGFVGEVIEAELLSFDEFYINTSKSTLKGTIPEDYKLNLEIYYDRNEYTVEFQYDNGDDVIVPQTLRYGATITQPSLEEILIPQGQSFIGWDKEVESTISEDVIYIAQFVDNSIYKVEHYLEDLDGEGYTLVSEHSELNNELANETVTATANVYIGFTYDDVNSTASGVVLEDNSLVLKMYYTRNEYTVKFVYDDDVHTNVIEPQTLKYGASIVVPSNETVVANQVNSNKGNTYYESHTFSHWNEEVASVVGASDLIYTTIYISNNETYGTYYIEYYHEQLDGTYEVVETITGEDVRGTTIDASIVSYEGFVYNENALGTNLSGEIPSYDAEINELKLCVYYDREVYTVDFIYEDGTKVVDTQSIKYEGTLKVPSSAQVEIPSGYEFVEWTPTIKEVVTENATYTLVLKEKEKFSIAFQYPDGTNIIAIQLLEFGTNIIIPTIDQIKIPEGYEFEGWTPEVSLTVNDHAIYTAVFKEKQKYTVRFVYPDGEDVIDAQTLEYGDRLQIPLIDEIVIPEGYTFEGWTPNIEMDVSEDVTYTAIFKEIETDSEDDFEEEQDDIVSPDTGDNNNQEQDDIVSPDTGDSTNTLSLLLLWVLSFMVLSFKFIKKVKV